MSTRLVAAAVIASLVLGGTLLLARPGQPSIDAPSPTPGGTLRTSESTRPSRGPSPSLGALRQPTWTPAGGTITARYLETATLLPDGKVLVAGGRESTTIGPSLASAELYDPVSGTSTPTGSMATPRSAHTATLLRDGRVLVVGGYNDWAALVSAELYDPASGTWSSAGSMTEGHGYHTATLLRDGKVLVAGGRSNNSSTGRPLASAELYEPASETWSVTGSLIQAHTFHTATLLPDARVLVAGASYRSFGLARNATAELYDPSTGFWSATANMLAARAYQTATLVPGGQVLVAGGTDVVGVGCCQATTGQVVASSELYEPASGSWSSTGAMTQARGFQSATALPDGTVLVAGGEGGDPGLGSGTSTHLNTIGLASAELYDPGTRAWSVTAAMSNPRMLHATTMFADGRVLVFGGLSNRTAIDSVEIYDPGVSR